MFPAGDPAYRVSFPRLRSGTKIRVVERGEPACPPVLLVHGWGCSAFVFRDTMPALADAGFRAIAVDLKGHGLSDKPVAADEYTVDALLEHLLDILDALGLERPPLIGHSLGGTLIHHFAMRYPQRARCLGLISPVGLTGVTLMWLYRALTPRFFIPLVPRIKPRLIVKVAMKRVYGKRGRFTERDVEEFLAPSQFPEFSVAMRHLLHRYDWNATKHRRLAVVDLPAAGIWGTIDHLMPDDGMGIYLSLIPRIVLHAIVDGGHLITQETPDDVNSALLEMLSRTYENGN